MNIIEQHVPEGVDYISDWKNYRIPDGHCIIDKDICGCGYTEYCIRPENPYNIILCSPRIILLKNKMKQHSGESNIMYFENDSLKNDFIGRAKIKKKDFAKHNQEYLKYKANAIREHYIKCSMNGVPSRFLVTYDSFHTLLETLGDSLSRFHIIVDEFQSIFNDAFFKANVENEFLQVLQKVPNVAYLSATPMMEKYMEKLTEFKDLPYYKIIWPKSRISKAYVQEKWVSNVITEALNIIDIYKNRPNEKPVRTVGDQVIVSNEVTFFVNSINTIKTIINRAKLLPDEVNIICADTQENRKKVRYEIKHNALPEGSMFDIGEVPGRNEPHKAFTFCTRTVYLGADFYSKTSTTVVLSDANVRSLVVDIRLDLPQILGRQRLLENPWKNECIIFYKTLSDGSRITREDFDLNCSTKKSLSLKELNHFNSLTEAESKIYLERWVGNRADKDGQTGLYLSRTYDGRLVFNDFLVLAEERAWELCQEDYVNDISVVRSLRDVKYIESEHYQSPVDIKVQTIINTIKGLQRFSDRLKAYCEIRENYKNDSIMTKRLLVYYSVSLYEKYYSLLGIKGCSSSGFKESNIKKKLQDIENRDSVSSMIYGELQLGQTYTLKELKDKLRYIYNITGTSKSPVASDILNYFEVQEKTGIDKLTKKRVRGYKLISYKQVI